MYTVYFDTNIYNSILDNEMNPRVKGFLKAKKGAFIYLSPLNIEQIACCAKSDFQRFKNLLNIAFDYTEKIFLPQNELMQREIVSFYKGENFIGYFYSLKEKKEIIKDIKEGIIKAKKNIEFQKLIKTQLKNNKGDLDDFRNIKKNWQLLISKIPIKSKADFQIFWNDVLSNKEVEAGILDICNKLGLQEPDVEKIKLNCPCLNLYWLVIASRIYYYCIKNKKCNDRDINIDMAHHIYAKQCDIFVTEDRDLQEIYKNYIYPTPKLYNLPRLLKLKEFEKVILNKTEIIQRRTSNL